MQLAQEKMPDAKLYSGDFKQGLVEPLRAQRYDFILATYSLHHLTDAEKVLFLNGAAGAAEGGRRDPDRRCGVPHPCGAGSVQDAGRRIVGRGRDLLRGRRAGAAFPQLKFVPFSACAGILSLRR